MNKSAIPQTSQRRERNENVEEEKTLCDPLQTEHGVTTIGENMVAKIARMATRGVPGVYDMSSAVRHALSTVTDRIPNAQTNVAGGVDVQKGETQAVIEVTIIIEYGVLVIEVSSAIRRNVIEQLEGATGLEVAEANIDVTDVHLPGEDADDSEPAGLRQFTPTL